MSSSTTSPPANHHLAAVLTSKGSPFTVTHRPTPTPGPHDLLVAVSAVALNPVDHYQRDLGAMIAAYPAVLGSDVAGTVLSVGSAVPSSAPQPGTRVAAFATAYYHQGAPDHGALQTRVLVPAVRAVPLPAPMGFAEATLLPMAVATAWAGWYTIGVARDTKYTAADKQGMLVWGAASSVGTGAVQSARLMGFEVYATASREHHAYLKGLGASKVWDYHADGVVQEIVQAAKADGLQLSRGFHGVGQLKSSMEVLKEFRGEGTAMLASAPRLPDDMPKVEGVEAKFVAAPEDEKARAEHFHFVFGVWLKEKLATGEYVPSPHMKIVEGGLEGAQKALDELKAGVSGTKLVLEV